jgi:tRNA-splicing ligase RtcB
MTSYEPGGSLAKSASYAHQMAGGVWYDYRHAEQPRYDASSAYKDIRAVASAQRDLVKIVRVLRPVLNCKRV